MIRHSVGVDEAGRGPLAGPVAVGAVLIRGEFDWEILHAVDDSKKLSPAVREHIFHSAQKMRQDGLLDFHVAFISAPVIDRIGIVPAVRRGVARTLRALSARAGLQSSDIQIKLDGALKAPELFPYQETIIRGDGLHKVIGLASILAKVSRDRYMRAAGKHYPEYGFELHKGYGTLKHRQMIEKYGLTDMHRKTFCTRLKV